MAPQWRRVDAAHYLHPFTDHKALRSSGGAKILVGGKGCSVWDAEGNRYLDGFAGLACVNVGYGRPELTRAAAQQMEQLSYGTSFFGYTNVPAITLSERLAQLAPVKLQQVFYANSGSDANDTAIRMVRHFWALEGQPERRVIISRHDAYHGSSVAAAAMSGMSAMHGQAATLPDFAHIDCPYQFGLGRGESEEAFGLRSAGWLEEKILEIGPQRVAAFFAEPVQGAGGVKIPPRNYFREIERICRKYDVLLVMDEVITGFGRTGNWFGSSTFEVGSPDMMCVAKGITSGYLPLSAVLVGERVAGTLVEKGGVFAHGFTYSGHPVSCAVALENLRILEEEGIVERVRTDTGPYFAERLGSLASHDVVGEVRAVGMFAAVELVRDRRTLEPIHDPDETCERVREIGMKNGIIVRPIHSTVCLAPPLVISKAEIDSLVEQLRRSLDEFHETLL
jgi:putrescine aminotransferase